MRWFYLMALHWCYLIVPNFFLWTGVFRFTTGWAGRQGGLQLGAVPVWRNENLTRWNRFFEYLVPLAFDLAEITARPPAWVNF